MRLIESINKVEKYFSRQAVDNDVKLIRAESLT